MNGRRRPDVQSGAPVPYLRCSFARTKVADQPSRRLCSGWELRSVTAGAVDPVRGSELLAGHLLEPLCVFLCGLCERSNGLLCSGQTSFAHGSDRVPIQQTRQQFDRQTTRRAARHNKLQRMRQGTTAIRTEVCASAAVSWGGAGRGQLHRIQSRRRRPLPLPLRCPRRGTCRSAPRD
jgi:hypothetical protein